jgi:hypothetical protein
MGVLKSLARKVGAGAARFAKKRITGALDSATDALERAVFGETSEASDGAASAGSAGSAGKQEVPPDPFAELKEKQRKESGKVR